MLTLGDFAKLIDSGVSLDTPIQPVWAAGPPSDDDPAVCLPGLIAYKDGEVQIGVALVYLDTLEGGDTELMEATTPVFYGPKGSAIFAQPRRQHQPSLAPPADGGYVPACDCGSENLVCLACNTQMR